MNRSKLAVAVKGAALAATMGIAATAQTAQAVSLTLLHNNDGESKLLGAGSGFGDFGQFAFQWDQARSSALGAGRDVIGLTSGDNILPGISFTASQNRRGPLGSPIDGPSDNYFDALALTALDYDAIVLGNHDFDFGPDVLGDFIGAYNTAGGDAPWLSSNLDFSAESSLQDLVTSGSIAKYTTVVKNGNTYGIIGATTESLPTISSPGGVTVSDVLTAVNQAASDLTGMGVDKIILSSHLQGINAEKALIPNLQNIDVVVAGGGSEILANDPDIDTYFGEPVQGPYPQALTDADGKTVALVGTGGDYRYIGALEVEFNASGEVISLGGDPIVINDESPIQAQLNGIEIANDILRPLFADDREIRREPVAQTNVGLDGVRNSVRTGETNLGSLIADAFVFAAEQTTTLGDIVVGLTNGGGIRNSNFFADGTTITEGDVLDTLPFPNDISVLRDVTVADLVTALENAVGSVEFTSGRFAQVSGIQFTYDPNLPSGSRVLRIEVEGTGQLLYTAAGGVVDPSETVDIVTNSFLAAGGDDYEIFTEQDRDDFGIGYAVALSQFLRSDDPRVADLAANYPVGGLGRITAVPVPAALWLFGSALVGLFTARRRAA